MIGSNVFTSGRWAGEGKRSCLGVIRNVWMKWVLMVEETEFQPSSLCCGTLWDSPPSLDNKSRSLYLLSASLALWFAAFGFSCLQMSTSRSTASKRAHLRDIRHIKVHAQCTHAPTHAVIPLTQPPAHTPTHTLSYSLLSHTPSLYWRSSAVWAC